MAKRPAKLFFLPQRMVVALIDQELDLWIDELCWLEEYHNPLIWQVGFDPVRGDFQVATTRSTGWSFSELTQDSAWIFNENGPFTSLFLGSADLGALRVVSVSDRLSRLRSEETPFLSLLEANAIEEQRAADFSSGGILGSRAPLNGRSFVSLRPTTGGVTIRRTEGRNVSKEPVYVWDAELGGYKLES